LSVVESRCDRSGIVNARLYEVGSVTERAIDGGKASKRGAGSNCAVATGVRAGRPSEKKGSFCGLQSCNLGKAGGLEVGVICVYGGNGRGRRDGIVYAPPEGYRRW